MNNIFSSTDKPLLVVNPNLELIRGLRGLANFLERTPQFPRYDDCLVISYFVYDDGGGLVKVPTGNKVLVPKREAYSTPEVPEHYEDETK
jgi:hypothetical protein